ncbi:MAG: NUDIX domain-containing protein [Bacteroidia bacterium]
MSAYDSFTKHYISVDNIIFGFAQGELKVLLIKRNFEPHQGKWSLMGGFVRQGENLQDAAARVVLTLTGLADVFMEQVKTYGAIDRDDEDRTISVAYYALIRVDQYDAALGEGHGAKWFPIEALPKLIFDHAQMIQDALKVLQEKTRQKPIGFNLLPLKFTIPQLRLLYEVINQKQLDHGNFSKKLHNMQLLERLDDKDKSQSKKGAYYYRFDPLRYRALETEGLNFDLK